MKNEEAISPVVGAIIIIGIVVILAIVIAVFVTSLTSNPAPDNKGYIDCKYVYTITDLYKTPEGYYVSTTGRYLFKIGKDDYDRLTGREYFMVGLFGKTPVNVTFVNESQSGYRDACIVTP
jgi:flagellin-like protein